jgi:DNA-binding transcriptional ArsR family regulator
MDEVFRALADPSRRRLLDSLSDLKTLLETGDTLVPA